MNTNPNPKTNPKPKNLGFEVSNPERAVRRRARYPLSHAGYQWTLLNKPYNAPDNAPDEAEPVEVPISL